MENYTVVLCKPLDGSLPNDFVVNFAGEISQSLGQASSVLAILPIAQMLAEYASKFEKRIVQSNTFTLKSHDMEVQLTCSDYHIKFEQLGLQLSYKPYWELELLASKYDCLLCDLQTKFITRNLPGSLVKFRMQTLIDGVSQLPIAPVMPKLGNYLGTVEENTHQITQKTGILFEQRLEDVDYAELACIEHREAKYVIRNFVRNPAVEILSVIDTPIKVPFQNLLKVLNLSGASSN